MDNIYMFSMAFIAGLLKLLPINRASKRYHTGPAIVIPPLHANLDNYYTTRFKLSLSLFATDKLYSHSRSPSCFYSHIVRMQIFWLAKFKVE